MSGIGCIEQMRRWDSAWECNTGSERRIRGIPSDQVCNRLIGKNRISATHRCLTILERIPGEPDPGLKVFPIGVIHGRNTVINLNKRIGLGNIIHEAIKPLSGRHQPVPTKTQLKGQIRSYPVIVLNEKTERSLSNRG